MSKDHEEKDRGGIKMPYDYYNLTNRQNWIKNKKKLLIEYSF